MHLNEFCCSPQTQGSQRHPRTQHSQRHPLARGDRTWQSHARKLHSLRRYFSGPVAVGYSLLFVSLFLAPYGTRRLRSHAPRSTHVVMLSARSIAYVAIVCRRHSPPPLSKRPAPLMSSCCLRESHVAIVCRRHSPPPLSKRPAPLMSSCCLRESLWRYARKRRERRDLLGRRA